MATIEKNVIMIKKGNGNEIIHYPATISDNVICDDGQTVEEKFSRTSKYEYYGTCSTAAATQVKVVNCPNFVLEEGAHIRVIFTNAQTYNGAPKLNVNNTGEITVQYKLGTNAVRYIWSAGTIIDFTYNGTYWIMHRSDLATTTYYGLAKLANSAVSTSTSLALVPASLNNVMNYIVTGCAVYSASSTYAVGDRVRYGNYVYECTTAITVAESWNAEHWKIVEPLLTKIDNIENTLDGLETLLREV